MDSGTVDLPHYPTCYLCPKERQKYFVPARGKTYDLMDGSTPSRIAACDVCSFAWQDERTRYDNAAANIANRPMRSKIHCELEKISAGSGGSGRSQLSDDDLKKYAENLWKQRPVNIPKERLNDYTADPVWNQGSEKMLELVKSVWGSQYRSAVLSSGIDCKVRGTSHPEHL